MKVSRSSRQAVWGGANTPQRGPHLHRVGGSVGIRVGLLVSKWVAQLVLIDIVSRPARQAFCRHANTPQRGRHRNSASRRRIGGGLKWAFVK